jgi:hypothetical protein
LALPSETIQRPLGAMVLKTGRVLQVDDIIIITIIIKMIAVINIRMATWRTCRHGCCKCFEVTYVQT